MMDASKPNGKPHPEFLVKHAREPMLVSPAEETKKGLYFLSNLDQNIAVIVRTIYCFGADEDGKEELRCPAEVIRRALEKVLVHYYPLAGRLTLSPEGKLTVDCTGEGAIFVEAKADCALGEIGDITKPDPETLGRLVYDIPGAKNILEMPPLVAQVIHRTFHPHFRSHQLHYEMLPRCYPIHTLPVLFEKMKWKQEKSQQFFNTNRMPHLQ